MNCPIKLDDIRCTGCEFQKEGLCDYPYSVRMALEEIRKITKSKGGVSRMTLWAGEWHSKNRLDGKKRHILYENCLPVLFRTRRECREYIKAKYGYIKHREDLRAEPHGWRMPRAIKVVVDIAH